MVMESGAPERRSPPGERSKRRARVAGGGCIPKAAGADMREESNTALGRGRETVTGETAT